MDLFLDLTLLTHLYFILFPTEHSVLITGASYTFWYLEMQFKLSSFSRFITCVEFMDSFGTIYILTYGVLCYSLLCRYCLFFFFFGRGLYAAAAKSLQSCPTLCDPIDGSPPGSAVPGILQARTLEWVAISFSNAWKWKVKVKSLSLSDPQRPHGLQPTRLLRPWDLPGKSTGVGCQTVYLVLN